MSLFLHAIVASAAPFESRGSLFDIGGYRLHLDCEGQGWPVVVLDSGLGGTSVEWQSVMRKVSSFTRICVYDRAGYGFSDRSPLPRTSSWIADELRRLLQAAGETGPFVLVGHSYGGYNVQYFARHYPHLTGGLVLVDSSHPSQVERFRAPPYELNTVPSSPWGIVQFNDPPPPHKKLSPYAQAMARYLSSRWKSRRALASEFLRFQDSARQVRESQPLKPMPVMVLTRGRRAIANDDRGTQLEQLWMKMQSELAQISPWSTHILARESGHHVHIEQPELVAYAIATVTDLYRTEDEQTGRLSYTGASERDSIDFGAATWLRDSLVMDPHLVLTQHPAAVTSSP